MSKKSKDKAGSSHSFQDIVRNGTANLRNLLGSYDDILHGLGTTTTSRLASASSPLLELPVELRIMIYEYATAVPHEIIVLKSTSVKRRLPALLYTSQSVRQEAFKAYNKVNSFIMILQAPDTRSAASWLEQRAKDGGGAPLRTFRFLFNNMSWHETTSFFPILEAIRKGCIILDLEAARKSIANNLIVSSAYHGGPFTMCPKEASGHIQAALLSASISARLIGSHGGCSLDTVDAAKCAFTRMIRGTSVGRRTRRQLAFQVTSKWSELHKELRSEVGESGRSRYNEHLVHCPLAKGRVFDFRSV